MYDCTILISDAISVVCRRQHDDLYPEKILSLSKEQEAHLYQYLLNRGVHQRIDPLFLKSIVVCWTSYNCKIILQHTYHSRVSPPSIAIKDCTHSTYLIEERLLDTVL